MLQVEPDTPHLWCVRDLRTGDYVARRHTREAADAIVDAWVRAHATQIAPRDSVPVQLPPVVEYWQVSQIEAWARIDDRWWAYAGEPRRWVSADVVRRHWPRERKHR